MSTFKYVLLSLLSAHAHPRAQALGARTQHTLHIVPPSNTATPTSYFRGPKQEDSHAWLVSNPHRAPISSFPVDSNKKKD